MTTAYSTDSRFAQHNQPGHPEHAGRLHAIQRGMEGLMERLKICPAREAADEDLLAVHTSGYLSRLDDTTRRPTMTMFGPDTYVTPQSYVTARLAAGSVLQVVDNVLNGGAGNGLVAVRPPGHHATQSNGMGFCLLNNIAVAARYVQRVYAIKRVVIVDYDVHHGNGTQDIFYNDPTVLYISTHQSPLYPGTGAVYETGAGDGESCTINIPLRPGTGDVGYEQVFQEIVLPAARRFEPEVILVSAGFDAHWQDPLAQMRLSLTGYDQITRDLIHLAAEQCKGRIVFVLEGGYNLDVLSNAWANVACALLDAEPLNDPLGKSYGNEAPVEQVIAQLKQLHNLP